MNAQPLAGIGLKDEHVLPLLQGEAGAAAVGFVEVHAENLMVDGGPRLSRLDRLRERLPLSVHGVGLSIGGAQPPCEQHLDRLARVLQRHEPRWFSEHLAWSGHGGLWFNDLLPLPYDRPTLHRVCAHIDRVQTRLRRPLLLENPSTYLAYARSTMDEAGFLAEVVRRTGCGVLLDVNNAHVSAVNQGQDAADFIERLVRALPAGAVGEIHLAGHAVDADAQGAPLLIDSHGAPVAEAVWSLYRQAIALLGPVPTLIERDQDVPPLARLSAEAGRAQALMAALPVPDGVTP
ncbi:DUF692 domain-containing protein [Hydrogenophaga sp. T2]|uniref:MNIO family bufferin maturase n=1 Tax=Hydrogenophaga sp. T2 TaxID=3132823 RepID=UPI003CF94558